MPDQDQSQILKLEIEVALLRNSMSQWKAITWIMGAVLVVLVIHSFTTAEPKSPDHLDFFSLGDGGGHLHLGTDGLWLSRNDKDLVVIGRNDGGGIIKVSSAEDTSDHVSILPGMWVLSHKGIPLLEATVDKGNPAIEFLEGENKPRMTLGSVDLRNKYSYFLLNRPTP